MTAACLQAIVVTVVDVPPFWVPAALPAASSRTGVPATESAEAEVRRG